MLIYEIFEEPVVNDLNSTNLEYIKINGLFGHYNVSLRFDKEVNIYIGENGLGKTTILNCVYYILKQRYLKLVDIEFSEICVKFSNENKTHNLTISDINEYNEKKMGRRPYYDEDYIRFLIKDLTLNNIRIDEEQFERIVFKLSRRMGVPMQSARRQLLQYIENGEIDGLLSDRNLKKGNKGDYKKVEALNTALNSNIKQNILYLTTYRRIEDDFSNLLAKEGNFMPDDMLIRFGMSDVEKSIENTLKLIQKNSIESFNKMTSVLLKQYAQPNQDKTSSSFYGFQQIDKDMLKIILDRLGNEIASDDKNNIISLLDNGQIFLGEYSYLLDLIVKLIANYDKQKIYDDKIKNFANTCNKYLNGKQFVYNQSDLSLDVKLLINTEEAGDIKLTKLSSGEKQIVSLFSRLYLDNDKDSILIIDEPELSLSMKWQKMLLPDIMRSGNCKFILTVTHSPFIFENEFDLDAKEMRSCITGFHVEDGK